MMSSGDEALDELLETNDILRQEIRKLAQRVSRLETVLRDNDLDWSDDDLDDLDGG